MLKTIKAKFIWSTILFIVLSVGIPIIFLLNQFAENFHQRSTIMLNATMDMLRYGLDNAMMQGSNKDVQGIVNDISNYENIDHIRLFDSEGKILYATDKDEIGQSMYVVAKDHIEKDFSTDYDRTIFLLDNGHAYSAFEAIKNENRCQSCHGDNPIIGFLDVDSHLTVAESRFYTGSMHIIYLAIVIIIILAVGFIYFFQNLIDKPLKKFLLAFDEVEKGNLKVRINSENEDEIGKLAKNFDRMVVELQNSRNENEELHFKQLEHAHKLAIIGELTSEMAHEINNHTAIIMSRADFLQLEASKNKNLEVYEEDFDVLMDQTTKVSKITGNILKHSKKSEKEFNDIELVSIIEESLLIFEPIIKKNNINLSKNIKLPEAKILGDSYQIDQILTNLINNAIDSIKQDGELSITLDQNKEEKIRITISDNGEGIQADNIEQIFSPFFTTKGKDKGTGLGLYIVKNICKSHNAEIVCSSKVGLGSSFIITFN